jgi:hypothetical protein
VTPWRVCGGVCGGVGGGGGSAWCSNRQVFRLCCISGGPGSGRLCQVHGEAAAGQPVKRCLLTGVHLLPCSWFSSSQSVGSSWRRVGSVFATPLPGPTGHGTVCCCHGSITSARLQVYCLCTKGVCRGGGQQLLPRRKRPAVLQ